MSKIIKSSAHKKDVIVAVRMPKGLMDELRDIQKVNHFMDLSDEIRYVVRRYCMKLPFYDQSKTELEQKKKDKLIENLTSMLQTLKQESVDGK